LLNVQRASISAMFNNEIKTI